MKRSPHHMSFLFPFFQRINIIIEVFTKKTSKTTGNNQTGVLQKLSTLFHSWQSSYREKFSQGPVFD